MMSVVTSLKNETKSCQKKVKSLTSQCTAAAGPASCGRPGCRWRSGTRSGGGGGGDFFIFATIKNDLLHLSSS